MTGLFDIQLESVDTVDGAAVATLKLTAGKAYVFQAVELDALIQSMVDWHPHQSKAHDWSDFGRKLFRVRYFGSRLGIELPDRSVVYVSEAEFLASLARLRSAASGLGTEADAILTGYIQKWRDMFAAAAS